VTERSRPAVIAAALLVAASGCSAKGDRTNDLELVRVAGRPGITSAPLFIADEEGFFSKEGIRIQYDVVASNMSQSIPALELERVDVLVSALNVGFFNAVARGARARMVADRGHIDPALCEHIGIVGRRSLFHSDDPPAAQLKGRKVSANSASSTGYILARYLASRGLKESDVEFIPLSDDVTPQALHDGSVDLVVTSEPRLTPLIKAGNRLIGRATRYLPDFQLSVVVFGPRLLVRDRELGQRFMNAYLRGVRQYNKGATPRNIGITSRRSGVDSASLAGMCLPAVREDGAIDSLSVMQFEKWSVAAGNQNRVLSQVEVSDPEFARRAVEILAKDSGAR
jgi:NitT/TauT family transport system substrate-binding protein